ncbi:MAG: hypothetical protein KatS3mg082_2114 [Nitrospiraceae bacterium]|jgi:hypothetical protein|nr:MAG: hypothetical protein KatS3mg082_2114 [Nitrospiraceae bacterium]
MFLRLIAKMVSFSLFLASLFFCYAEDVTRGVIRDD